MPFLTPGYPPVRPSGGSLKDLDNCGSLEYCLSMVLAQILLVIRRDKRLFFLIDAGEHTSYVLQPSHDVFPHGSLHLYFK